MSGGGHYAHVRDALSASGLRHEMPGRGGGGRASSSSGAVLTAVGDASLEARGKVCRQRYETFISRRPGVRAHVERLEAEVTVQSTSLSHAGAVGAETPVTKKLAVLVRGQAYRGYNRDSFHIDSRVRQTREKAQARCLHSLMQRLILPYERRGHRVDVFLTTYKAVGGPIEGLTLPLGKRVVSITKVQQATTPTQLLPLGAAVDAFIAWCEAHSSAYAAVVVSRFDLYLKVDMHALLGDASIIDGFRFLWREAGGHWRYHSDRATTNRTFDTDRRDWRRSNLRAPDALLAFPFAYTSCFRSAVRHEFFPLVRIASASLP